MKKPKKGRKQKGGAGKFDILAMFDEDSDAEKEDKDTQTDVT